MKLLPFRMFGYTTNEAYYRAAVLRDRYVTSLTLRWPYGLCPTN